MKTCKRYGYLKRAIGGILLALALVGCSQEDSGRLPRERAGANPPKASGETENGKSREEQKETGNEALREETFGDAWRTAYAKYLEALDQEAGGKYAAGCTYSFIYVDDDQIPELVCDSGFEAGGCLILTYSHREVDAVQTYRLNFDYLERKGLLCNSDGNMGFYYDRVFALKDGKWILMAEGEYGDPEGGPVLDEEDNFIFQYSWEGKQVSGEEYEAALKEVYDRSRAKSPEIYYDWKELQSLLKTGRHTSADHTYDLVVEDLTWREAREECRKRGGYLAVITSQEEREAIEARIGEEGMTGITFYVGANNGRMDGETTFGYNWIEPDGSRREMPFRAYYGFWRHYGDYKMEPTYRGMTEDGREVEESCLVMMYNKEDGRYYLNDVPDDMLDAAPSYKGNTGYICEYDESPPGITESATD